MSVNDQITRIRNNVTNSLSAVQEKGVSVPSGANSDSLPELIAQISGGAEVEEITNEAGGKSVYINSEAPKLPEGYTRLKYIESTGSQYVDTGFKPNQDTRVVMDAQLLSSSAAGFYFGARASGYVDSFAVLFSSSAGALRSSYGSENLSFATTDYTKKVHIDKNKTSCQLGSETLTHTAATFQNAHNMYLFASNEFGSAGSKAKMTLWNCQIYDNDVLVRDYVPCLNASNVAGLYDLVNGVFYGDAAGVGFIAGTVVLEYELPDGYEELEYIQSDGRQYADTGFKPNNNTRVVIDLQGATTTGGVYMHYGVPSFMAGKASSSSWNYYVYYNTQEVAYSTRTASDFTARHTIDQNKNVITTGADTRTLAVATFSSGYNMYLFGVNNNGSLAYASPIKVFSCQIYDNGTLVRYYVPCKNASGAAGLWDVVNETFTGDAAGVGFIAGPSKGVSKVVLEDQVLIDLTQDTVTAGGLLAGLTAHDATGTQIIGELVQKTGGRPFASGVYSPASKAYTMTISGLSFKPEIMFLVTDFSTNTSGTVFGQYANHLYYFDAKQNKYLWIYTAESYVDALISGKNGKWPTGGTAPGYVVMNNDGFTAGRYYSAGYYFQQGYNYHWYAIGAET